MICRVLSDWFSTATATGAGAAFVVFGSDWGLRLRPLDSSNDWDTADPDQWGETHLVLADEEDLLLGRAQL